MDMFDDTVYWISSPCYMCCSSLDVSCLLQSFCYQLHALLHDRDSYLALDWPEYRALCVLLYLLIYALYPLGWFAKSWTSEKVGRIDGNLDAEFTPLPLPLNVCC